jgi:Uma2 family endonuclease
MLWSFGSPVANRTPLHPHDVLLAVEIISPSSKAFDRGRKMKDYAYAKIPAYWIIDALAERVTLTRFALQASGDYGYVAQTDELVTVDQPWTATFDVPAWTRERDWLRESGRPDR